MKPFAVVILAAGLGKRMLSDLPKVAVRTRVCSLIEHVLRSVAPTKPDSAVVVTGYKRELVEQTVEAGRADGSYQDLSIQFAVQEQQLGTAHATQCGLQKIDGFAGDVLILAGDVPLVKTTTLRRLLEIHRNDHAALTLLTVKVSEENSYGRVVRGRQGIERIVEAKDCSEDELLIEEINSGIYVVDAGFLNSALKLVKSENVQREFYLTDIVGIAASQGYRISALTVRDQLEVQGVNTREEVQVVNAALRRQKISKLVAAGVTVEDPATFFLDESVEIGAGSYIGPMVHLRGKTIIGEGVFVEGCAQLTDCSVSSRVRIKFGTVCERASIGEDAMVGPFAHLRPGTNLGKNVKVGNFVETKQAQLEEGAKASHLTYLGDCVVGSEANIGAGTITCNYDGYKKAVTTIGKGAFIGSNSSLVAPVSIGEGAIVGAGSVITKNVDADSLALARAEQTSRPGWAGERRKRIKKS